MDTTPSRAGESEKITINLVPADLGHIDLLVAEGLYQHRSDFIRTAIRAQVERHGEVVRQALARTRPELGLRRVGRAELEALAAAGRTLELHVLGLLAIAADVPPELARATIVSVRVLGSLHASPAVKAALADRTA